MAAENKVGMLITDPVVAARLGTEAIAPETVWLLNRQAIARQWGVPPWKVEQAPAYEIEVALALLDIEAEAEKRRPKKKT